jgi:hypothetical protein
MVAINLRQKLQNVSCGASDDVRTHFDKLAEMNEKLSSIGVTLEDHEYASILIGSLPPIYEPTISSILAAAKLSKNLLDPDTVISLITDDFDRSELTKKRNKRDEKDVAFYVNETERRGGRNSSSRSGCSGGRKDMMCHNCKKKGHFKADCWAKGRGMEGKGPRGKKGGGRGNDKGATANVVEAEDSDDGVWAVADEEGEFGDWEIADDSESDWAFLSDFGSEENEDLPAQSFIPDAHPADAERLRDIMLESWETRDVLLQAPGTTIPSMPGLQSVSESSCSLDSMPALQSISATEYSFDGNPSPDDEATSCSDGSIHILPDNGFAPELSLFFPFETMTQSCSQCTPHIFTTCSRFNSYDPITSLFAGAALAGTAETRKLESDLYDSGASRHMTPFRERLINYTPIASRPITAADKRVFHAIGKGDMHVRIPNGATTTIILLKDVLYAPAMGVNIISVSRITAAGSAVLFRANFCRIFDPKNKGIGHIHVTSNGLYRVDHGEAVLSAGMKTKLTLLELHRRMGHIAPDAVRKLVEDKRVVGVELEDDREEMGTCESCEFAKATRKRVRKEREEPLAEKFGDEVHSDVWGPATTETIHHRKYYASFTDDSTRWSHVKLLHGKDDTFDAYLEYEAWADTQHGAKIKRLRSDRGGEYLSTEFTNHLKSKGTERRLTTHDTPEHNGVAESLNH